ncbi:MAG TPA: glycoside hydrolase family 97 protein [Chitinophagaceae bacterium]|jgi:alpha-glucosidase
MKLQPKLLCIICLLSSSLIAQNIKLTSPNGNLIFSFKFINKIPAYSVSFKGKVLVDNSTLSLNFDNGNFEHNLRINKPVFRDTSEDYVLIVGKAKNVHSHYSEVIIPLEEPVAPQRKINFAVRAFDDGIAFRYEFPQQKNWSSYTLLDENTTFKLTGNPTVHTLFLPNYTTSHEGLYSTLSLSDVKEDTLMDMPTLFEFPNNIYLAITEAALLDYAGMYLVKHNGVLISKLSPLPGQSSDTPLRAGAKVKALLPHHSPWRVLMISDRIGALIESNILTDLNEPCKIKDVGWIKPGKTTWPWWNGNVTPDTNFAPGNNFETNKYYIDFCARNSIEYHSVVEYGLHQWYVDDGVPFEPGPHSDVTKPVPGLDMQQVCDYAKQQGVGIRVWVHWAALYPKLDSALVIFEKWGIEGMMVDFMDRDDQEMVNIQTEILEKAAVHHLHIQFHGAYKPTGLNRTYPNEFTREGTRNYEVNKWDDSGIGPDHDINMPFTRMLAGATDYHLGGFRSVPGSQYKVQYTRPLMLGTRCHMLAMYVVLESYLQMVCDYPAAYEGQPGFEFIKEVPAVWDETKVIDAKVGEFITIARRKNDDWFIGTITNNTARQLSIPLDFLSGGNYAAEIYTDARDANENPNHLIKQTRIVTKQDIIEASLAAGGGEVMHLRKQ